MPKKSKHPRLRSHSWKTSAGEMRTAYYYDMRPDGKPDVSLGTDFATAVRKWDELHHHKPRIKGTVQEAIEKWRDERLPMYANSTTRRNYAQNLKRLEPVFGPATWESVTVGTIADYLEKRSAKVQANREKACLSVVWGMARRWGMTNLPFPAYKMALKNKESASHVEVSEAAFDAIYQFAVPYLRDAMDLCSATGLRIRDAIALRLSDVRGETLFFAASKTGKRGSFSVVPGDVLGRIIASRKLVKAPHVFLLTNGNRVVTERMLTDAWARARAAALPECPEVQGLMLRHMRKRAAQLAGSLEEARQLLQHGSAATTARHYRPGEKLRPVR